MIVKGRLSKNDFDGYDQFNKRTLSDCSNLEILFLIIGLEQSYLQIKYDFKDKYGLESIDIKLEYI